MASPDARRPVAALTAAHRPPNDLRAGIATAHKTDRAKRQALRDAFARLARNLAEVIDDLYRSNAPPRCRERVLDLVQVQVKRAMRLGRLLLVGFAGAFRRSELVSLDIEDIEETKEGLRVMIRRGKTDQESKGAIIAIVRGAAACPVAAYKAWIEVAKITAGPVFRPIAKGDRLQAVRLSDRSVAKIVKAHAARIGLDPAAFSGHSLRSGFLTSAASRGASIFKMMDVSRHKSVDTLRGYVRDAELFRDHAGSGLL